MTTCCPLSGNDGDAAEFHDVELVLARKAHRCTECGDDIAVGQRHERVKAMWDGSWSTFRTCLPCVAVRTHFACEGWIYGEVWNDIAENMFPTMVAGGPCLEGMAPEGKAKMFDQFLAWYFDGGYEQRAWWLEQDAKAGDARELYRGGMMKPDLRDGHSW